MHAKDFIPIAMSTFQTEIKQNVIDQMTPCTIEMEAILSSPPILPTVPVAQPFRLL